MALYIITVKLPKNSNGPHDPKNKITGECPVSGKLCTDVTGEHHSFIGTAKSIEQAISNAHNIGYPHVTRVELLREGD